MLRPLVGSLLILNQPPIPPEIASRSSIRNGARPPFMEDPQTRQRRLDANAFLNTFQSKNSSVIDIASSFQGPNGEVLFLDHQGRMLYQDAGHLSGYGARLVRPLLKRAISPPSP
jgi:hypothetical protein